MIRKNSSIVFVLLVIVLLVILCAPAAFSQSQLRTPRQVLDEAQQLVCKGQIDQAFALLTTAAEANQNSSDKITVTQIHLLLAYLYKEQGQTTNHLNSTMAAIGSAVGTRLARLASVYHWLSLADRAMNQEEYLDAQSFLFKANTELPKIQPGDRSGLLSQALTVRINLLIKVAEMLDEVPPEYRAEQLPPPLQVHLISLLKNIGPQALGGPDSPIKKRLRAQYLKELDAKRPLRNALLESALDLNSKVTDLDRQRGLALKKSGTSVKGTCGDSPSDLVRDMEVAKDVSQRGSILHQLRDLDGAIRLKQESLAVFDKYNMFIDAVIVLRDLIGFLLEKGTEKDFLEAFKTSGRAIAQIENQTHAFAGQSVGPFLEQFEKIYEVRFVFLLAQYKALLAASDPNTQRALESFLLQADRMNFRPTRRDLAIYREMAGDLGDSPENALRFEQQKKVVEVKKQLQQRAIDDGKTRQDYSLAPGMLLNDPFTGYEEAKLDLVSILEDFKRRKVGSGPKAVRLPESFTEVRKGMTASEAIVMYVKNPRQNTLSAAVITGDSQIRYVDLPSTSLSHMEETIGNLQDEIDAGSSQAWKRLESLSRTLWQPLLPLPENVTIVLIPDLLGIPFECLPSSSGKPAITEHRIQYGFGLAPRLGEVRRLGSASQVLLAGAEKYPGRNLSALPSSREELEGIGRLVRAKNLVVTPKNPLVDKGNSIISQRLSINILHLSTHSDLDPTVPMVDALVFPADEIYAYDLALSPLRADLAVLSACALFKKRLNQSNPVSGITTAMLAGIAPQVISTLWNVNGDATNVFMLRFYGALTEGANPLSALAVTKQAFLEPEKLEAWLKANNIPVPAEIKSYKQPYYWAAFVLTVGLADADRP